MEDDKPHHVNNRPSLNLSGSQKRISLHAERISRSLSASEKQSFSSLKEADLNTAKFVSLFVVPAVCACTPVLIPFGDAYAHSNDFGRNLRENWSYFFWYDSVGWSFLWLTMTVWT